MKKIYNYQKPIHVSGSVGCTNVFVSDFNKLKCPACGAELEITAIDITKPDEKKLEKNASDSCVDEYGQIHIRNYGRIKITHNNRVHMSCPNKCVEDMKFNVSNATYGNYRELNEIEIHEFCRK